MEAAGHGGGSHLRARFVLAFLGASVIVVAGPLAVRGDAVQTVTAEEVAVLTVSVEGDGQVVSSPSGVRCPGTCSASFAEGTTVTLVASGDLGGWTGACEGAAGEQCTLEMSSDLAAGANFTSPEPEPPPPPPPVPPPPPPGGGPPPPPTPLLEEIDRILEGLPFANIAFNAPTELRLGESAVIQLLMSGQRPIEQLQEELTELGEQEGAQIKVSDQVEARLSGLGFRIQAITPERQAVSGAGTTEWRWEIEPTESGARRLHLTVAAVIDVRGGQSTHTIRTFQRVMDVHVTWSDRVTGFLGSNWQWLWTAVLLPIAAWLWRSRRKSKQAA